MVDEYLAVTSVVLLSSYLCIISLARNALDIAADLVQQHAYESLVDFDNHLDDISQDWRNPTLNRRVDEEAGAAD
ncbi:hypothetical protein PR048_002361 [Dryococelus australis]|uniref:Uncharacterized protein n=1 Tax=Dryococelus australis TaxID=614101 RepID=A0ABQ9IJZ4_9NEOP|nr:hypothetical protein PR048_002361 [Dryococelus australis]